MPRAFPGELKRPLAVVAAGLLACASLYLFIHGHYRLEPQAGLTGEQASAAIRALRDILDGTPATEALAGIKEVPPDTHGSLWIHLYLRGVAVFSARYDRGTLRTRLTQAAGDMKRRAEVSALSLEQRRQARFKLDVSVGEGPILSSVPFLFAKSVVPGVDGVALHLDGRRHAYLLPDELFQRQLLAGYQPFWFMHEFKTGLDIQPTVDLLAERLDVSLEQWRSASKQYTRVRVQSFVEDELSAGGTLPVERLRVRAAHLTARDVRSAVERAAFYVLRQILPDGKFQYIYYPLEDSHSPPGEYSLPRHAGTTWFLSLAYSVLRHPLILEGARAAIKYLAANAVPPGCQQTPYACVGDSDFYADLGSTALAVVAIAQYQQATGDRAYLPLARQLGKFLLFMQKPNGDFCHQYCPKTRERNCVDILLYYTGEASLALAKLHQITGDKAWAGPLERSLDFLTGEKYAFFLGKFFISEDHWTCIAAEAAFKVVNKDAYAQFCYEFSKLNHRVQVRSDEGLAGDLAGAFNITPFFIPHNTPVGSRTEANVATYRLSLLRGEPHPLTRETVMASLRYLLDQQIRPSGAYHYPNPAAALGGMLQTPTRAQVRIDYVQHAAAALARALPILEREERK